MRLAFVVVVADLCCCCYCWHSCFGHLDYPEIWLHRHHHDFDHDGEEEDDDGGGDGDTRRHHDLDLWALDKILTFYLFIFSRKKHSGFHALWFIYLFFGNKLIDFNIPCFN